MTSVPKLAYVFGTYLGTTPNVATLRNMSVQAARRHGDTIFVNGAVTAGDGNGGVYCWMPASLDDDDGQQTIKPFDVPETAPGRWKWSIRGDTELPIRITTLESHYNDPTYGPLALFAQIENETTVRLQDDTALIDQLNSLETSVTSQFQQTDAKITDESTVRSDAVSALAQRTTTLEATVSDPNTGLAKAQARITDESNARANADSALSTRTSTLEATVNDPNTGLAKAQSRISDESTARANADGALANRTSTLEAQMAGTSGSQLSAQITNEATVRANADQALSDRVTNVEANTGNGNISARVTTVESAVASLNGKTAAYFQVQSVAGNNRAELNIHADANGGAGIDLIGDVHIAGNATIDGNVIVGGTVTTPTLAPNTASQIYYAQSTSTVTISTNVEGTAIYVDCNKSYADTVMKVEGIIRVFSPDDAEGQYNMYRDATLIDGMYVYQVGHGSNYNTTISFVHVDADSGTGSRRYKITYIPKDNDVSSQQIVTGTSIIVTEVKR